MDKDQRQKFINDFSARVNDTVLEVKMAQLNTSESVFDEMRLVPQGKNVLWGLVVVCSKSLYFYVPSNDHPLMSMVTGEVAVSSTEEQIFSFNNADGLQFSTPKKTWFKMFSLERIDFSFIRNGHIVSGAFYVDRGAEDLVIKMLLAYRA